MSTDRSFTGRSRVRTTSPTIWWTDRIAKHVIAIGGIGTIAAVLLVFVFLLSVAIPLFRPAKVSESTTWSTPWKTNGAILSAVNEYRTIGWALFPAGKIHGYSLTDGSVIGEPISVLSEENSSELSAAALSIDGSFITLGFSDGTIRQGSVSFDTTFVELADAEPALRDLPENEARASNGGIVQRIPNGLLRHQKLKLTLDPPVSTGGSAKVLLIDGINGKNGPILASLTADGKLRLSAVTRQTNLLTDEVEQTVENSDLPLAKFTDPPRYLLVSELGDNVTVAWRDGKLTRFDTRDFQNPQLIETIDLVAEDGESLTSLTYLLGRTTLLAGDSLGRVQAWFSINPQEGDAVGLSGSSTLNMRGTGRNHLVVAHTFPATGAAVSCLASSSRIRMFAAGYSDGTARLFHVTSEAEVLQVPAKSDQPIQSIDIAPKNDALVAFTSEGITRWDFDAAHPEVSVATLFRPVWYEGRSQPEHSWQSSGGNDNFEPKYGFMPLVFGTIKATVYSMMFGAPLALLAAIYSSEFLNPRIKSRVKPIIELMASLPSVVLGFIAGLVIAPMIEDVVPSVIAAFGTIPLCFVLGAYLWQLLPPSIGIRYSNWKFAAMLFVALPAGILMASLIGPGFESTLFSGDFKAWLDGRVGGGTPGWAIMFLPLCGLAVAMFVTSFVRPWLRQRSTHWSRWQAAMVSFATFLIGALATILLATIAGQLLNALHLDPRGVVVGQYQQRNAMIVGFIMGFAIIPIIYTIADDALSSVPATLRSASLGAGATPWQTAMRVIMPTAMSGLFSALMIGLGRAVGETMIVLMAAGNTPLMDWNIFNGFQTLSANIATELPEAAQGSTHYRTLFLAALTLFVMTFFINTIAEIIRQRFRKRAYEL